MGWVGEGGALLWGLNPLLPLSSLPKLGGVCNMPVAKSCWLRRGEGHPHPTPPHPGWGPRQFCASPALSVSNPEKISANLTAGQPPA